MTGTMTPAQAIREEAANLTGRWILHTVVFAIALAIAATTLAVTLLDRRDAETQFRAAVDQGAYAFIVTDRSADPLPAAECARLGSIDGVEAAGGQRDLTVARTLNGTTPIRVAEVTEGMIRIAWPDADRVVDQIVLDPALASQLGLASGVPVRVDLGASTIERVAAVPPATSRIAGLEGIAAVPVSATGDVDSCIVWARPADTVAVEAALSGWFGPDTIVSPFTTRSDLAVSAEWAVAAAAARPVWAAGAGALVLVLGFTWYARRHDVALYRILGARESSIVSMLTTDAFVLAFAPLQLALIAVLIALQPSSPFELAGVIVAWGTMTAGIVLAPLVRWALSPQRRAHRVLLGG